MDKILIVIFSLLIFAIIVVAYKLFGIERVRSWLLWAVCQAEAEYGGGTGKLKLAMVYDMFIDKFPKLQSIIPYRLFSNLVDSALVLMREMLKNEKINDFIISKRE